MKPTFLACHRGLGVCLAVVLLADMIFAQQQAGGVITGKITAVEAKGKNTVLKLKDDAGTEHSFDISPRMAFQIQSDGDDGFFAPGLFVEIDTTQSNKAYFGTAFLVYPDQTGRIPPARAVKAPPMPGQSTQRYFVSGEIARFEKVEDGKYDLLHLKVTPKSELTVYIEPNHTLKVVQKDPQQAAVGQTVTVEGRLAGTRLIPAKITIETGVELKGEEFLAARKDAEKK